MPRYLLVECDGGAGLPSVLSVAAAIGPTRRPRTTTRSLVLDVGELIAIDVGLGLFDALAPLRRLGVRRGFGSPACGGRPRTLRRALESAGIDSDRVTHVVLSHAHPDNVGAVADFPGACLHALPEAVASARLGSTAREPGSALPPFAQHQPYRMPDAVSEDWYGFRTHRLDIASVDIRFVELPGHAPGHAGVLVRSGSDVVFWLGDALTSLEELEVDQPRDNGSRWLRLIEDDRPFEGLLTRERVRKLWRRPPTSMTFSTIRGVTSRLVSGPGPHPHFDFL